MNIQGRNQIDTDKRIEAMQVINKQPTIVLERLAMLSNSDAAAHYLLDDTGFLTIKTYLGI